MAFRESTCGSITFSFLCEAPLPRNSTYICSSYVMHFAIMITCPAYSSKLLKSLHSQYLFDNFEVSIPVLQINFHDNTFSVQFTEACKHLCLPVAICRSLNYAASELCLRGSVIIDTSFKQMWCDHIVVGIYALMLLRQHLILYTRVALKVNLTPQWVCTCL